MKRAVIVVGPHFSGKSKTIKKYFKPLVGIAGNQRAFTLNGGIGTALSQSAEERRLGRVVSQSTEEKKLPSLREFIAKYLNSQWLVLAARPADERGSHLNELIDLLGQNRFAVSIVEIKSCQPEGFYQARAKQILAGLA